MRIALCNEVIRELEFTEQCAYAASLGYDGLEVAPFTLADHPRELGTSARLRVRQAAASAGIEIVGLHWLLVTPVGLSINSPDPAVRNQTVDLMRYLIDLCADLEGQVLIHGSPEQRRIAPEDDPAEAWGRARDTFASVTAEAEAAGILYCIEPLTPSETDFINTVDEALKLVEEIDSPVFRTMIDTRTARHTETRSVPELIDTWVPEGVIGHVHLNDRNRGGPGQGQDDFAPVLDALNRSAYGGTLSVEPFDYRPDGKGAAARAIGYIRGIQETLNWTQKS